MRTIYKPRENNKDVIANGDLKYDYFDLLSLSDFKKINLQYFSIKNGYIIFAYDGPQKYYCIITKYDTTEYNHFISNVKNDISNTNLIETKDRNYEAIRVRPMPVLGDLHWTPVYFKTSDNTSFKARYSSIWDVSITSTQTILTFMPQYNYSAEGGRISLIGSKPLGNLELDVIVAPYIPVEMGGSIETAVGKKFIHDNEVLELYSSPKFLRYESEYPYANSVQFIFNYDENLEAEFEISMKLYK